MTAATFVCICGATGPANEGKTGTTGPAVTHTKSCGTTQTTTSPGFAAKLVAAVVAT